MTKIAVFDAKPYDRASFDAANAGRYALRYFETRLTAASVPLAEGCAGVCAFVNDVVDAATVEGLVARGVKVLALRCAGYNNVDFKAAFEKGLTVVRVPAYSPYAVAEHAMALLMTLNRHLHKAAARTRDFNFSLVGLTGMDLHGKTAGVVGTGKIGRIFCDICKGLGMRVLAYDAFPNPASGLDYVTLDRLLAESDVVSLHCPLTPETHHLFNAKTIGMMKPGAFLVNTSRGGLVESGALLDALRSGRLGGAGLDVYEEESDWFYDYVVGSIQYGWITGYEDGTFRPDSTITRAEVTAITNRMLGRAADEGYVDAHRSELRQFPDLEAGYWAYYQIMEAANAHTYAKDSGVEGWTGLQR